MDVRHGFRCIFPNFAGVLFWGFPEKNHVSWDVWLCEVFLPLILSDRNFWMVSLQANEQNLRKELQQSQQARLRHVVMEIVLSNEALIWGSQLGMCCWTCEATAWQIVRVVEKCVHSHFKALEVAIVLKHSFLLLHDFHMFPSMTFKLLRYADFDFCEDLTEQEALLDAAELYHHATLSE